MIVIDGDYPMAHGALRFGRDLTKSIEEARAQAVKLSEDSELHANKDVLGDGIMASLPEMRKGNVAVAIVKVVSCIKRPGHHHGDVLTDVHSNAEGQGQLAYYHILEELNEARILKSSGDFKDHVNTWVNEDDHSESPVGMVLGMEGADPITSPEQVHDWYEKGLRVISLSHYGVSRYSHGTGTGTEGGLMGRAKQLLQEMDSLNMILDLTHTSDESIRQELEIFSGRIIATHQNCREIVPGERQFPDHQIKSVIERGGIVGHSMDTHMLWPKGVDWSSPELGKQELWRREDVTLSNFVDHIDHVCQLAGDSLHSSIGADTDGQGGRIHAPFEIDTVADYQKVAELLKERGYESTDIDNIMYRNWQRFFEANLPV